MYLDQVSCGRPATSVFNTWPFGCPGAPTRNDRQDESRAWQRGDKKQICKILKKKKKKKRRKRQRKIKTKFKLFRREKSQNVELKICLIICSSFFVMLAFNFFQLSDSSSCFDLTEKSFANLGREMIEKIPKKQQLNLSLKLKRQNQIVSNNNNNHKNHLSPSEEKKPKEEPKMVNLGRQQRQEEQRRLVSRKATVEKEKQKKKHKHDKQSSEIQGESQHLDKDGRGKQASGFDGPGSGWNNQLDSAGRRWAALREKGHREAGQVSEHELHELQVGEFTLGYYKQTKGPEDLRADKGNLSGVAFISGEGAFAARPETKAPTRAGRAGRRAGHDDNHKSNKEASDNKSGRRTRDEQSSDGKDNHNHQILADDKVGANLMSSKWHPLAGEPEMAQTSGPVSFDSYQQADGLDLGRAANSRLAALPANSSADYLSSAAATPTSDEPDNASNDQEEPELEQEQEAAEEAAGEQVADELYGGQANGSSGIQCDSLDQIMATRPSYQTGLIFGINYTVVFVCGLLGNVITLYVLICKGKKCTCQDILIGNLACSDIMLCVFAVPVTPKYLINDGYWTLGLVLCKVVSFAQSTSVYMSTYSLICIGYIRYRLIIYPLEESMSKQAALLSCLGTWLVGIIVTLPYMLQVRLYPESCEIKFCDEAWSFPWRFIFSLFTAFFQFMIPLASVAFFNKKIYSRLDGRRHTAVAAAALNITSGRGAKLNELSSSSSTTTTNNNNHAQIIINNHHQQRQQQQRLDVIAIKEQRQREKEKRMRKANNRLIFVVVVFAHSWLPLNLYNIAQDYFEDLSGWPYLTATFLTVHLVACSSVCWNPILYAWMSESYRQDLRNALPSLIISRLRCLADPGHSSRRYHKPSHSAQHSYISTTTHTANPTHSTFFSSSAATCSSGLSTGEPTSTRTNIIINNTNNNNNGNNNNNNNNNNNHNNTIRRQLTTIRSHPLEHQEQQLDLELNELNNNGNNNSLVICYDHDHLDHFDPGGDQFELDDLISSMGRQQPADEMA